MPPLEPETEVPGVPTILGPPSNGGVLLPSMAAAAGEKVTFSDFFFQNRIYVDLCRILDLSFRINSNPFEKVVSQRDRGMNGFQKTAPVQVFRRSCIWSLHWFTESLDMSISMTFSSTKHAFLPSRSLGCKNLNISNNKKIGWKPLGRSQLTCVRPGQPRIFLMPSSLTARWQNSRQASATFNLSKVQPC